MTGFQCDCIIIVALVCTVAPSTSAAVTTYNNKSAWQNAAGAHATITFTEYPHATLLGEQYAELGVTFAGTND